ncbi:amidase family protein [Croceiramulus getboli]|nr:amidase family protein [Flavobacteriaceae bacterium YJPT1-3]
MLRTLLGVLSIFLLFSCKQSPEPPEVVWVPYDESQDLMATQELENSRMHMKLINAVVRDKNEIWAAFNDELKGFASRYEALKPLILEVSIPELQDHIMEGKLTYEELTRFYLFRIREMEADNTTALNGVIALNPDVLDQARILDKQKTTDRYSLRGMPILLKDNIGYQGLPTTAGAVALQENFTEDAFITKKLKAAEALILGKANLSEWAYFLCSGCPVGYSAVGGQTINPYGRLRFESGGSSSGSGVSTAANYAVATIGSETSGSILSPSSQNNIVGLKPTIGLLSRSGIVPISSTLDTPGPMTKNVIDNALLLQAMLGQDAQDAASFASPVNYVAAAREGTLSEKRIGYFDEFMETALYAEAISDLEAQGAILVPISPERVPLNGFLNVLNLDMKQDLPEYLKTYGSSDLPIRDIESAVVYNAQDSVVRIPYGQQLFRGITKDTVTAEQLMEIKERLQQDSRAYFDGALDGETLDAVVSINNYHAAYAAMAKYPALTVPMGFTEEGEPMGLTFIAKNKMEHTLYGLAAPYEKATRHRRLPENYR